MPGHLRWWTIAVLWGWAFSFSACAVSPPLLAPLTPAAALTGALTEPPATLSFPAAAPTATPLAANVTPARTPTATPLPGPRLDPALVQIYPLGAVTGDWISFDVEPVLAAGYEAPYTVTLALPDGQTLSSPVSSVGFDRQPRARFIWAWNTTGLTGTQLFTVTLMAPPDAPPALPGADVLRVTLPLQAPETLLPPEPGVRWDMRATEGIRLHYLTGSAAERDLATLLPLAQGAYAEVAARFEVTTTTVLDVYMLDRILGQGGYATSDWVAVSYTDRVYAPSELTLLLRHELTHRLDSAWGCDQFPSMIREGLAVLVAGGHYWPESLPRNAAALLQTGPYVPLQQLLDDFYLQQHEIGYLEAGALLAYIVEERGWEGMRQLCEAGAAASGEGTLRLASALAALDQPPLPELERDWLRWLQALHVTAEEGRVLQDGWLLMDTVRAYQSRYDPSAYFLTGILFDPAWGAERGITADFVRRPREARAIALELLLQMAQESLRADAPAEAERLAAAVQAALEPTASPPPEVTEMEALVAAVLSRGYEPYRVVWVDDGAKVGQRAPGCVVYALDRADWPMKRVLWAARDAEAASWSVVGPQLPY